MVPNDRPPCIATCHKVSKFRDPLPFPLVAQFVVARKSLQQHYAVGEKCVINMMELVHSVSDWMIMMIGLGGLLLLSPAWNLQKYLIIQ